MTHALRRTARFSAALAAGIALVAVGVVAAPQAASAASFAVTTTADTVDAAANCLSVTPGTLPGPDGLVSLREAVCASNRSVGADVISLPAGTYTLTGASLEDFSNSGDLDVWDNPFGAPPVPGDGLTITGAGAASTIIDAASLDRVFDVISFTSFTFTLSDVTLRNGNAGSGDGGAIQTGFDAATELFDVVIENSSAANGGAIANIQGELTMYGTVIRGNTATIVSGRGGGVYSAGVLRMQATTVSGNWAVSGGGLLMESASADISTIEQSTISGNTASSRGGGIATNLLHNGQTVVTDTTIANNVATVAGGGVSAGGSATGELLLSNATVTGNSSAGVGGIIQTVGSAILEHSIVAENTGGDVGGAWTGGDNFVGVAGGSVVDGIADNRAGTVVAPLDPQLRALGQYGGLTQSRVPLPTSPVIDAAVSCGAVDQRGVARTVGAGCDYGSVELTAAPDTTITSGPAAASTVATASFAFSGTGGTGPYTFECQLDSGLFVPCASPSAVSGLADGSHTYAVRAIDSFGATDAIAAQYAWSVTTQLAASGPSDVAPLLGGAGVLLLGGLALIAVRMRRA